MSDQNGYFLRACIYVNGGRERGALAQMARRLGKSRAAMTKWLREGVPPGEVDRVCELCDDIVTPHQLRPDLFRPLPLNNRTC